MLLLATTYMDLPEAHCFLGMGHVELGRPDRAKREFEEFLSAPDSLARFVAKDWMRFLARGDWLYRTP